VPQLVEVKFKGNRKAYFEWHEPEPLRQAEPVIVESARGLDFGVVSATGAVAEQKCTRCQSCAVGGSEGRHGSSESNAREVEPTRRAVRRATPADRRVMEDLRRQEDDVRRAVRARAASHGLQMKVSDAEWQWDRNRLTVYFTADKRVDFRTLVRELAATFRTRIELRQIGVRDEAARLNGIGRCGRELCSASWLPELRPIGLHIAKDQRLSLNPAQISGPCGRLLCCLRYEHEFYVQSRKRFPKEGKVLRTSKGAEKVYSVDIFRDRVSLRGEDGSWRTVALLDLKQEIEQTALTPAPEAGDAAAPRIPAPDRRTQPRQARENRGREDRRAAPRHDRREEPRPETRNASEPLPEPEPPVAAASAPQDAEPGLQATGKRRRGRRGGRRRKKGPGGA
jgi:cell fate regulator YaaT (PSP1 superfamily)